MDKRRITYLIKKLRRNEATMEERDELESFWQLAQGDDNLLVMLSAEEKESVRKAIFEAVKSKITLLEKSQSPVHRTMPSSGWFLKIAASIVFVIVISVFRMQNNYVFQEIHTAYGEHKTITLPDNSTVVINGNSMLRYNALWSPDKDREVWIDGEVFFDVTHTLNDQKFIVHTQGDMDVHVLGTKFNVKTRRGKTEVMLEEGKVRLDIENESAHTMVLQPGELATLEDKKLLKVRKRAREYVSWKEHKLFFDQTPLREIANILEDTYGMVVFFEDETQADRKLSGEISADKATDIIHAIQEAFDIRITNDGHRIIFHK
jgi:transmembrane sensor